MTGSPAIISNARGLEGKVAIVTGSGRGIGFAAANALAAAGAKVVVNDSDATAVEQAVENIRASGGAAIGQVATIFK
jgi:NAD(P)-dependent dehydrogenase (short-subunit alcohol dehydrogenase family)